MNYCCLKLPSSGIYKKDVGALLLLIPHQAFAAIVKDKQRSQPTSVMI
ncbi:MAG: hypothetical protein MR784_04595 [Rikenellaceae bacterium]|nr:hypothetical protein [Rikenellaceae bacterium]